MLFGKASPPPLTVPCRSKNDQGNECNQSKNCKHYSAYDAGLFQLEIQYEQKSHRRADYFKHQSLIIQREKLDNNVCQREECRRKCNGHTLIYALVLLGVNSSPNGLAIRRSRQLSSMPMPTRK